MLFKPNVSPESRDIAGALIVAIMTGAMEALPAVGSNLLHCTGADAADLDGNHAEAGQLHYENYLGSVGWRSGGIHDGSTFNRG